MPLSTEYVIVNSRIERNGLKEVIIMTYLTEEEEKALDDGKRIKVKRSKRTFVIDPGMIYCYGDVDFREGSDDCDVIDSFSFLDYLGAVGIRIPSDYHYDTHECHSPLKCYRYTETFRPSVLCRYCHGVLGKPKNIVLFRRFS